VIILTSADPSQEIEAWIEAAEIPQGLLRTREDGRHDQFN